MDSIIFDVDGTLWDSTEIVAESWDEYLHNKEHMNITITAERLMGLFGQPLPAIAAQLLPDKNRSRTASDHRCLLPGGARGSSENLRPSL